MHPNIAQFPTVIIAADIFREALEAAGIFDDDWAEALLTLVLTLVLTLEADLLTLAANAPVEYVQ